MKTFIPLTDELLSDHPELIHSPCVPYRVGVTCIGWLDLEHFGLDVTPHPNPPEEDASREA